MPKQTPLFFPKKVRKLAVFGNPSRMKVYVVYIRISEVSLLHTYDLRTVTINRRNPAEPQHERGM
jgi:hypothetical protein